MTRPPANRAKITQRPKRNPARSALSPEEALRRRVLDPGVALKRRVRLALNLAGTNPALGVPLLMELRKSRGLTHQQADKIDAKLTRKAPKLTKQTGLAMAAEDRARLDKYYAELRVDQPLRIHARELWRYGLQCEQAEIDILRQFEEQDAGIPDIYNLPALL